MAADAAEEAWRELIGSIDKDNHEKALEAANAVLKLQPNEPDALRCKAISLIHLSKFADAIALIKGQAALSGMVFERAYCHYRLNELDPAFEALKGLSESDEKSMHLRAQLLYRMGRYSECAPIYEKLLPAAQARKEPLSELKTNYAAAVASSGRSLPANAVSQKEMEEGHELAYNVACERIEAGDLDGAQRILELAHKVGRRNLEADDFGEEEIADELAAIAVQLAYVRHLRGEEDAALEGYQAVLKSKPSDPAVAAVASNNVISIKKDKNLFDAMKKSSKAQSEGLTHRLTPRQKLVIASNRCLLLLLANKADACRELSASLAREFPESDIPVLVGAALLVREKKAAKAEEALRAYVEKNGRERSTRVLLTLAQLELQQGNAKGAVGTLQSIEELRHEAGMVGTVVRLLEQAGDVDGAVRALHDAVKHIDATAMSTDKRGPQERLREQLLEASGKLLLAHGRAKEAVAVYERLLASKKGDPRFLYGLVLASAAADPDRAEALEAQLPPMRGAQAVDADLLESVAPPRPALRKDRKEDKGAKRPLEGAAAGDGEQAKKKRKRKKKPRLPKNYDPNTPPDPERWLPRNQRTHGRKGKGKKAVTRGPQGLPSASAQAAPAAPAAPEPPKAPAGPPPGRKKGGRR
eukprot:tig00021127_g18865.t1